MKNAPIFLFIAFCLISRPVFAQKQNKIEKGGDLPALVLNPFIDSLQLQNEFVIAFRVLMPMLPDSVSTYFILSKNYDQLQAFRFGSKIVKLNLSNVALESIWSNFSQNGLLTMMDERNLIDVCPQKYDIYNSYSYEFIIFEKGKIKRLTYYYPEYYDEVCPGLDERKKIINSVAVVALFIESEN